jgi:CubicO group peptidase (beta-lactamase class C family)
MRQLRPLLVVTIVGALVGPMAPSKPAARQGPGGGLLASLEHGLEITQPGAGTPERLDLAEALRRLRIPSVGIALIEGGKLIWAGAHGDASARTLYQAASLSTLVTAVAALRLMQQGRLDLDRDVNSALVSWHVPESSLTRGHPVTLRGLLSMTGGIGVPGYLGYEPGSPLPSLVQILDGLAPANSPPVRVEYVPGSAYAYSGGGYEIAQALIEAVTHRPFADAVQDLVLRPLGMSDSVFAQPPPPALLGRVATGHQASGAELPGGWRVVPELAAGGLWSTPTDLAKLLVAISRAYRGEDTRLLAQETAKAMLTPQNGGPYGLGAALGGSGRDRALMKRGQNVGYQGYMLVFPETGQGMVVMTGSDNGTTLANALMHRAAVGLRWPPLGALLD